MLSKLLSILENVSHPLSDVMAKLKMLCIVPQEVSPARGHQTFQLIPSGYQTPL